MIKKGSVMYHCTGALLEKGSVLLPGTFGILINERYGTLANMRTGVPNIYFYEKELEHFRIKHYPEKPSRFKCIFMCHSKNNFDNFIKQTDRVLMFGYRVEIIDEVTNYHIADWHKYDSKWASTNNWLTEFETSIKNYWSETQNLNNENAPLEVLVNARVKVLERVF